MTIFRLLKHSGPFQGRARKGRGLATVGGILLLLSGCNTLPDSGPTESQVNHSQRNPQKNTVGYGIVQVTPELIALLASQDPPKFSALDKTAGKPSVVSANDTVGPGDILQVSIYEVGSALFSPSSASLAGSSGSSGAAGSTSTGNLTAASTASGLPPLGVDGDGNIEVPFAGVIHVAGMTISQVSDAILARLKQKSQAPQVMVRIMADIANSVMVYGGVRRPSRIALTPNQERILDVIALAGGEDRTNQPDEDYVVRLTRNGHIAEMPLKIIENDPEQNIVMEPGDRVQLTFQPRSFTVFGASGRVTQTQFSTPTLTMAEAISRNGGPIDARADPNAVYLFRFENADVVHKLGLSVEGNGSTAPIVYQLDMMNPSNYFLADKFMMRDQDLIYIANASSNKFYKFFGLISTLIAPGITAAWIAK